MENKLKGENYYTTDLWLRRGSNPPKNIKNKIKNMSVKPVRINDQDKANERNYRPRFLKSNPYPYVPIFTTIGDEQQKAAAQQGEMGQKETTSPKVNELMALINDNKIQESDFQLLVDAAKTLSGPEKILLNRRLFESASRGAQKMLQILNPNAKPREVYEKAPSRALTENEMKEIFIEPERKNKPNNPNKKNRILDELLPYNNFGNDEVKWDKNNKLDGLKIDSRRKMFKDLSDEAMAMAMTPKKRNTRKSRRNLLPPPTKVTNPLTGRLIEIGGKLYNRLRKEGLIRL
jgi:hypothetical protein